ncbi:MAG: DUF4159 domain-containing protein [Planktomarina sp.]|nr:DUF4159 domain-containing protein [Planktomarina sp.]
MSIFGALGFSTPWLLLGLVALPILWVLLRAVPPAPTRRRFPGVALLLRLKEDDLQTDKTPWWLLLLRALVVASLIIGLAGPVLNPAPMGENGSDLLVVMEGSWADAPDWAAQKQEALRVAGQAGISGRKVAFLQLTAPGSAVVFSAASLAQRQIQTAEPKAWLPEGDVIGLIAELGSFDSYWMASPLDWPGRAKLVSELLAHGELRVSLSQTPTMGLLPITVTAQGVEVHVSRLSAGQATQVRVDLVGLDPSGVERRLQSVPLTFEAHALLASQASEVPQEMRNRISRVVLAGYRSAAAVRLVDDRIKRPEIAILSGEIAGREGLTLLSPDHYLTQALAPVADLINGTLEDVLLADPDTIVLADVAKIGAKTAMVDWVSQGGTLVRFAGPRLAAQSFNSKEDDPLLPVRLRAGGRTVGGAMSWGAPKTLQAFEVDTPFFGLPTPDEVIVTAQVLAEPGPDLAAHVIARLSDGTPLVTRKTLGQGQVVLFHITANADWSNLPISGLFVSMLERLSVIGSYGDFKQQALAGTTWQLVRDLDGFGTLKTVGDRAGVDGQVLAASRITAETPAGVYQGGERRWARNILAQDSVFTSATWLGAVQLVGQAMARPKMLGAGFLSAVLVLLVVDILATLWIVGKLRGRVVGALACFLMAGLTTEDVVAQTAEARAIQATRNVVLAYVKTGDLGQDEISHAGLTGLSLALNQRTSIEPVSPMGLALGTDELAFYPFIYWPITLGQSRPNADELRKLNRYIKGGGMILFDTRDSEIAQYGESTKEGRLLQEIAAGLNVPPIAPISQDHVLTRSFYLLQEFPGRSSRGTVWVEAPQSLGEEIEGMPFRNLNDGVTPVVIGGNDWAAAWAVDLAGQPLLPVGRGLSGKRQREIALRFGINLIMHVLTGNYKSDQVHVPELLKRLGE